LHKLVRFIGDVAREVLPTGLLGEAAVWEALLEQTPMTAMIHNLSTLADARQYSPERVASPRNG